MTKRSERKSETKPKPDALDKVFEVSLVLKGLDGLLEIIGGLLLLFVSSSAIQNVANKLTAHELSKDPHDFLANHLISFTNHLTVSSVIFGSLYLLTHGLVKVILVIAVLKQKLWAYPWMIGFLIVFIVYQLYRLSVKFTFGMMLLTLFDAFIVYLTVIEYRKHKRLADI